MRCKPFKSIAIFLLSMLLTSITVCAKQKKIAVDTINVLTAFVEPKCIYCFDGAIDLRGQTIQIPEGCCVDLAHGGVKNGRIIGNNTKIKGLHKNCIAVIIEGSWLVNKIKDSYFDNTILSDDEIISNINYLQNDKIYNHIVIQEKNYEGTIKEENGCLLNLSSNTKLSLKTIIAIKGNNFENYNIVRINLKENVMVEGGTLIGDVGKHTYMEGTTSQWGHGLYICYSKNVVVKNMTSMNCIGDGFTITGWAGKHLGDFDHASSNIVMRNVNARYNRRQGISIIYAKNVKVLNSIFSDTGTIESNSPSAGIDIEPNLAPYSQSTHNIEIINCRFERNVGRSILSNHYANYNGVKSVEKVIFKKCYCDGRVELHTGGIKLINTKFLNLLIYAERDPIGNLSFYKCTIEGNDGVDLFCSEKKQCIGSGIENLVFEKCSIAVPVDYLNSHNGQPVNRRGRIKNIGDVRFNKCNIKAL